MVMVPRSLSLSRFFFATELLRGKRKRERKRETSKIAESRRLLGGLLVGTSLSTWIPKKRENREHRWQEAFVVRQLAPEQRTRKRGNKAGIALKFISLYEPTKQTIHKTDPHTILGLILTKRPMTTKWRRRNES